MNTKWTILIDTILILISILYINLIIINIILIEPVRQAAGRYRQLVMSSNFPHSDARPASTDTPGYLATN